MTEEELREKIADIIDREDKNSFALPCMDIANQILTLIHEAGWLPYDEQDHINLLDDKEPQ